MVTDFEGFTINEPDNIVDAIGEIKGPTSTYRKVLLKEWIRILRGVFKESIQSIENALPTASTVDKATKRVNPAHVDEGVTHE
jgi:hypothetical protein